MYAVVQIAGFQELVKKGDTLKVPLQDAEPGKALIFGDVLLTVDGDKVNFGLPFLKGVSVEGTVKSHGRGDKIRIVKAHKRKRYRRVKGHRQDYTEVEVVKITA